MSQARLLLAALALIIAGACTDSGTRKGDGNSPAARPGFVARRGRQFVVDGRPFRFIGANVALMYREEDRERMPETLAEAARDGISVVRVWAYGEGRDDEEGDVGSVGGDRHDWPRKHPFRYAPGEWNEEAFLHLDRVLAEARRNNLRVQLCLTNWWRDTGGVTQYLRWAGIRDAADEREPFGINVERAMLFYTNEETRRLYREHIEKILTRRNTVTGELYRDDPTIFAYELMNEAQAPAGRRAERRAWVAEMSAFIKQLDPHHLVTPGTWGYRASWERREWLEEHRLPQIDFCDVHNYPRDDLDSYVDSPRALGEFIDNRAAAAFSLDKPLVLGEFGMVPEGYQGVTQDEWFRAYFAHGTRAGASGIMYWIWTPDPKRGYGVTYTTQRDAGVRAVFSEAARRIEAERDAAPPAHLLDAGAHLIPRQFVFERGETEMPVIKNGDGGALVYRFAPEQAVRGRFEKMGGGGGYVWGNGCGFFEYLVPAREDWRSVGEVVVRARLQPVPPHDARGRITQTRVTLLINGRDCGSRLVPIETEGKPITQEWRVDSLATRMAAAAGRKLLVRLAVEVDADHPYGLNITNYPGHDSQTLAPVEVEIR